MIIIKSLYLSNPKNIQIVSRLTDISEDELVEMVGIFNKNSHRAGQVRGEFIELVDGSYAIRHHFTKKILWRSN